jgi:hypothetical protein
MSDTTKQRDFHSVAIRMAEEDWRKFRALVSLSRREVGAVAGEVLAEWIKQPSQRVILSNLGN